MLFRSGAVGHAGGLRGLPLAAVDHAEGTPPALIADRVTTVPELRIAGFVENFFQRAEQLSIFDLPKEIAAELEIQTVLVDGKTALPLDIDAVLGIRDQLRRGEFLRSGSR